MRHSRQQQKSVIAALTDSRQKTRVNHFQARPCPIKIKHKSTFSIQHQTKELDLWKSFYCFRIFFTIEKFHQSPWLEFITWRLSLQWHIFWIHTEGPFHHKKLSLASLASFSASLSRFLFLAFSFLLSTLPLFSPPAPFPPPPAPFPPALPLSPGCFFFFCSSMAFSCCFNFLILFTASFSCFSKDSNNHICWRQMLYKGPVIIITALFSDRKTFGKSLRISVKFCHWKILSLLEPVVGGKGSYGKCP